MESLRPGFFRGSKFRANGFGSDLEYISQHIFENVCPGNFSHFSHLKQVMAQWRARKRKGFIVLQPSWLSGVNGCVECCWLGRVARLCLKENKRVNSHGGCA